VKPSIVKDKSYAFALRIITMAKWLREKKEFEIARQVLRSGTAVGSNVEEALAGISRADFIAKMSIASKEAREPTIGYVCCATPKLFPNQKFLHSKPKAWNSSAFSLPLSKRPRQVQPTQN
jgi:four helix bundle protein